MTHSVPHPHSLIAFDRQSDHFTIKDVACYKHSYLLVVSVCIRCFDLGTAGDLALYQGKIDVHGMLLNQRSLQHLRSSFAIVVLISDQASINLENTSSASCCSAPEASSYFFW